MFSVVICIQKLLYCLQGLSGNNCFRYFGCCLKAFSGRDLFLTISLLSEGIFSGSDFFPNVPLLSGELFSCFFLVSNASNNFVAV